MGVDIIYMKKRMEKRQYVIWPGIEPRTHDLRVRCPTDCATRPGKPLYKQHIYRARLALIVYFLMPKGAFHTLSKAFLESVKTWFGFC